MILVDADFFIGIYLEKDAHHISCIEISQKIAEQLITTHDVIDEVITKMSYFKRIDIASKFYNVIKKQQMSIVYPTPSLDDAATRFLQSQNNSHVSLTDCMNMVVAREKGIEYILSFDKNYEKNGFKLFK